MISFKKFAAGLFLVSLCMQACNSGNSTEKKADEEKVEKAKQEVAKSWSELMTSYQRREDLSRNLAMTAKGIPGFDQSACTSLEGACMQAMEIKTTVDELSDKTMANLQQKQDALTTSLRSFMNAAKNNDQFSQVADKNGIWPTLEGEENRMHVAMANYNSAASNYNVLVTEEKKMPLLHASAGSEAAPKVQF